MAPSLEPVTRRSISAILIVITIAVVFARIVSAQNLWEPVRNKNAEDVDTFAPSVWPKTRPNPVPTFGSNDRSRWATIHALVHDGTYVIGERDPEAVSPSNPYGNKGLIFDNDGWFTIDAVLNPETHKFYSSKPPFLSTILAGEYWLLHEIFGWSLKSDSGSDRPDDRWTVVRVMLLSVNALPMLVYLVLLARLLDDYGTTDWGRLFVLGSACFGTMLLPFAITLNNHSIATCTALFGLYPALRILQSGSAAGEPVVVGLVPDSPAPWQFVLAGFFSSFTACTELPALSFTLLLFALLLMRFWRQTLLFFVVPALVPIAMFLLTNFLAIGEFVPAYEKTETVWYQYPGSIWNRKEREERAEQARQEGRPVWEFRNIDWAWHPQGAHESKTAYAFHLLVGHHGLFSLMPIFLISLAGIGICAWRARQGGIANLLRGPPMIVAAFIALVLLVVIVGFYIYRTSNYGGFCNGPRWLMWLAPFLLLAMLPAADWLAERRWGRWLGYACLAVSVFSMNYWTWNPWRHPWIYNWMDANGWLQY